MANLSISLLGPFQVSLDGAPVSHFEYVKVQALLAYLAVEVDHPHRRETVAEILWPDQPEQVARTNLRQALSKLRRVIYEDSADPPHLIVTQETLQFNSTSQYELDVATFLSLIAVCEKHVHQKISTCSECAQRLVQAVMLYHGVFLEQVVVDDSPEFEEWMLLKRESLQRKALDALYDLTEYYEHQPNYDAARRYAWRQIELDPCREQAHRQLMRVLALSGERNAALAQYERCCQLLAKELDVEPDSETIALYDQIRNGEISEPRISIKMVDSLPYQATPFVGREAELRAMTQLLMKSTVRLVTILGPGGMGKTRLALETATTHQSDFMDGVCFVPLASLTDTELLVSAIADSAGLQFYPGGTPKQQLLDFFREKSMLIVLDNFEQILTGATLVADILGTAHGVKMVVTSRERLNLQEETLFRIEGMDVPASGTSEGAAEYGALKLFLQSARRVQPSFTLTTEYLPYVVSICRQVEGMPLGILLAAAWVDHISLAEISKEIEHSLDFLETEQRDVPTRQRSIRAAFDSSWRMLSEQVVFSQLAVFRGGFTREAAQAVAGATLKILAALANKSFIRRDPNGRYTIHELLRQYAESKLSEVPSAMRGVRDRHCAYFADFMKRQELRLKSAEQLEAIRTLEADFDNIRAAWNYAAEQINVDALDKSWQSLFLLGVYKGQYHEQQIAMGKAIDCLRMGVPTGRRGILFSCFLSLQLSNADKPHPQIVSQARESQTLLRQLDAPFELAFVLLFSPETSTEARRQNSQESLEIFKRLGDQWGTGRAYVELGADLFELAQLDEAEKAYHEAADLFSVIGTPFEQAFTTYRLASVYQKAGDYWKEIDCLEAAITAFRLYNSLFLLSEGLNVIGKDLTRVIRQTTPEPSRDYEKAGRYLAESLAIVRQLGNVRSTIHALENAGMAYWWQGRFSEATHYLYEGLVLSEGTSRPTVIADAISNLGHPTAALGQLTTAEGYFRKALHMAVPRMTTQPASRAVALKSLAGLAYLMDKAGNKEDAVELLALAHHDPMNDQEAKEIAERYQNELRAELPPDAFAAAQERGCLLELDKAVAGILASAPLFPTAMPEL